MATSMRDVEQFFDFGCEKELYLYGEKVLRYRQDICSAEIIVECENDIRHSFKTHVFQDAMAHHTMDELGFGPDGKPDMLGMTVNLMPDVGYILRFRLDGDRQQECVIRDLDELPALINSKFVIRRMGI